MEAKERYLVSTTDGKTHIAVVYTFKEVIEIFGEENIWQMIKLSYTEPKGEDE